MIAAHDLVQACNTALMLLYANLLDLRNIFDIFRLIVDCEGEMALDVDVHHPTIAQKKEFSEYRRQVEIGRGLLAEGKNNMEAFQNLIAYQNKASEIAQSAVAGEKPVIEAAAYELADTQKMIEAAEKEGKLRPGVTAKDLILHIIGRIGVSGGTGHVLEYRGSTIRALSMDERMTICNMSIEAGARAGMIAPDETTFEYLKGKPRAPQGAEWDAAVARWRALPQNLASPMLVPAQDDARILSLCARAVRACWGTASPRSALMGSRCCSCIPRISAER